MQLPTHPFAYPTLRQTSHSGRKEGLRGGSMGSFLNFNPSSLLSPKSLHFVNSLVAVNSVEPEYKYSFSTLGGLNSLLGMMKRVLLSRRPS